ncbi:MAG: diacylglycerol kinase family lipid kinase [Spirochaetia bacterium]|nr:diacylglycerol kinase family lipid kinase [Spirochaetia bacterium]
MSDKKLFILLNPHAAKGKGIVRKKEIMGLFSQAGYEATVVMTEKGIGASTLAYQATLQGWPTIIAAGGDGTVNEVVDGVLRAVTEMKIPSPKLGVLPVGRGNDFAWGMGIPRDLKKASELIIAGKTRTIDAGITYGGHYPQGRYFVNGQGMGFEPLVNFIASDFKHVSGTLSYVLALVKILVAHPEPFHVQLTLDGECQYFEMQQLSICNGRRMGGAFLMGPDALFDDGYFDVVFTNRPVKNSRMLLIALKLFKGTQVKLPVFSVVRAKSVSLVSENNPMPVHVDGEEISKGCMQFSTELLPSVLPVFVL